MTRGLLVLAIAFGRYCGPLPPDVQAVVTAAMNALTADQRFWTDRDAYDVYPLWRGSVSDAANNPPSIREKMRAMQIQQCELALAQLQSASGQGGFSEERLKKLYTPEELEELERQRQGK
jgi:hypothetical protein